MMILSAITFCKSATCPSAEMLVAYGACALEAERTAWVEEHLGKCDFCGAELKLLTEHTPQAEEECPLVDMPLNLRCLAQSLLTADWLSSIESLAETAYEKERLTLTDA